MCLEKFYQHRSIHDKRNVWLQTYMHEKLSKTCYGEQENKHGLNSDDDLRSKEQWDRGFESFCKYGCMSAFLSIMLYCVGRGSSTCRSPVQRPLGKYLIHSFPYRIWWGTNQRA